MNNLTTNDNFVNNKGALKCKVDLSRYFHPPKNDRDLRFKTIYKLFSLNDDKVACAIGISRTTMNRYRRGVFEPNSEMKLLIAQKISCLANYSVDSAVLFGDDLFFYNWEIDKVKKEEN